MQTVSLISNNDIDIVFKMPVLTKKSPKAISEDKFTGDITLKEEKVIHNFMTFLRNTVRSLT